MLDGARGRMVWSVTLLARYVPANEALAVGRIALAEREGVPKRICLASIVYELGFTFAGATIVGAYFLVTLPSLDDQPLRWLALAMPVAALAALDPRVFHTLADFALGKLGREPLPLSITRGRVLGFVAGFAVCAFAQGIHGLGDGGLGIAIGSYSVGFAASVLAFLILGGLGAREGWVGRRAVPRPARDRGARRGRGDPPGADRRGGRLRDDHPRAGAPRRALTRPARWYRARPRAGVPPVLASRPAAAPLSAGGPSCPCSRQQPTPARRARPTHG